MSDEFAYQGDIYVVRALNNGTNLGEAWVIGGALVYHEDQAGADHGVPPVKCYIAPYDDLMHTKHPSLVSETTDACNFSEAPADVRSALITAMARAGNYAYELDVENDYDEPTEYTVHDVVSFEEENDG